MRLLATSSQAFAQQPAPVAKVRIQLGRCDQQVVYNLPAQRFDQTARAIARATGCFIRYPDKSLVNVPVQPVARPPYPAPSPTRGPARLRPTHCARNAEPDGGRARAGSLGTSHGVQVGAPSRHPKARARSATSGSYVRRSSATAGASGWFRAASIKRWPRPSGCATPAPCATTRRGT
jgi:hypothetical protein